MSKLPRDVTGEQLVKALERIGYRAVRQTGSHVRLKGRPLSVKRRRRGDRE